MFTATVLGVESNDVLWSPAACLAREVDDIRTGSGSGGAGPARNREPTLERPRLDNAVIHTSPQLSVVPEFLRLTGEQRCRIRVRAHRGRPGELHVHHRHLVAIHEGDAP